jgi:hypothetical protein
MIVLSKHVQSVLKTCLVARILSKSFLSLPGIFRKIATTEFCVEQNPIAKPAKNSDIQGIYMYLPKQQLDYLHL